MDHLKIANAIERLERNLPLRHNQLRLPGVLRRFHQGILRHYLEFGSAPLAGDVDCPGGWAAAVSRLAAEKIIVVDEAGAITSAYPFINEAREFTVVSEHGAVNAMCAFDALAISSMFALPTRIESRCRVSGDRIVIEQDDARLQVLEPAAAVRAAINWDARDGTKSCSASLCTEMIFIAGDASARCWQDEDSVNRELFRLDEAHRFICSVFLPLIH